MSGPVVLLAGGGSGGHISPGLAIAEAVKAENPDATCLFAHSQRPIDSSMLHQAGQTGFSLPARPPSLHPTKALQFMRRFAASRRIAEQRLREDGVDVVVLLGGFVAAPVAAAARRVGTPSLLVNLDRVPGRANRWMRPRATRIMSAVSTITPFADDVIGMPIRLAATPPGDAAYCRQALGLDQERPTLLVTGASQGAGTINRVMPALAAAHRSLLDPWQIVHLAGPGGETDVRDRWRATGMNATVLDFRHDMGVLWGCADLVVSRAGACSVAEIEYAGLPAIYLPYPHHRDQHQRHNAAPGVDAGAAICVEDSMDVDQTQASLAAMASGLLERGDVFQSMQMAARARSGLNGSTPVAKMVDALTRSGGY